MKQRILYILLLITAWIGGSNVVWGQEMYYIIEEDISTEIQLMTSGSKKTPKTYTFNGQIGETLTFDYRKGRSAGTGVITLTAYNSNDETIVYKEYDLSTSWESADPISLPQNTVKIVFSSIASSVFNTYEKYIRNVKVTRATTFSPSPSSFNWDLVLVNEEKSGTIYVSYNNTYKGQILTAETGEGTTGIVFGQFDGNMVDTNDNLCIPFTFSCATQGSYEGSILLKRNNVTVATIPVTASIGKRTPTFNFSLSSTYANHVYNLSDYFSTDNPNAYTITSDDESKAKIIDGKLYVLAQSGEFYLTASQAEDDTWYGKTERYKVSVSEEITTTYSENIGDFDFYSSIVWNTYNKQLAFPFPCDKITYDAKYDIGAVNYLTFKISKDHGVNWEPLSNENRDITDNEKSFTEIIDPTTTHIDIIRESNSSLGLDFYNFTFHMASYITPSQASAEFGRIMVGETSATKNITVDWSDVEDYSNNLKVKSDNPNFIVSVVNNPCTPANQTWGTSNQRWGQSTISISYAPQTVGTHSGNIYFYDNKRFITIPVSGIGYAPLELKPSTNPSTQISEENIYSLVTLERTFPAGYSTATFPFDYDIKGNISGAKALQLAFVTYNQEDLYTLYFEEVADGIMLANQPYVVELPFARDKPQWNNVTVKTPVAGSVSTDRTQGWTMQGNYTPGVSMEGKWGIAGGKMCLGAKGATINAYTAYFISPTTQKVRTRVAIIDGDGNTTYIGELKDLNADAPQTVFGIDGTRLPEMKKGINIVRMKDGSVRKIVK